MRERGHLAEIETIAEDYFLRAQLLDRFGQQHNFWIGGTDNHTEGTWVWKSGKSMTYTDWGKGEPNSWNGRDEDCIDMSGYTLDYAWSDGSCSSQIFSICERSILNLKHFENMMHFTYSFKRTILFQMFRIFS